MAINLATYDGGVIQARCPKCGAEPQQRCMSASGVTANAHIARRREANVATKGKTVHKWTADDPKMGMTVDEMCVVVNEANGLGDKDTRVKAGITIGGRLQWLSIEVPVQAVEIDSDSDKAHDGTTNAVRPVVAE